ncbi:MAG: sulfite oxidase [Paracoccaceae bacterium]
MTERRGVPRRHFVLGAAGAGILVAGAEPTIAGAATEGGAEGLPDYVAWKKPDAFIQHSPQTLETERGEIGAEVVTPSRVLYVRNNLPSLTDEQVGEPDAWTLSVEGVASPGEVTVGELKGMDVETVCAVLQCSGNGRAFFEHETSGSQWSVGAAGNVLWTGVPVTRVVEAMGGPASGAAWITGTGGEPIPEGLDPKLVQVERSVPIAAMENALLAWAMNGEPLANAHGAPLRLVLPGYFGVNHVKHLKRLALTEAESEAKIQQSGYRVRPVGEGGTPSQPSMFEMPVKSWVTHPLRETSGGRVLVYGVAMGGTEPLARVEVSTDGGASWSNARFVGPDMGPYAWRPFVLAAELGSGTHTLASRATTVSGETQPEAFPPNHRGYGHNGWADHAVDVEIG